MPYLAGRAIGNGLMLFYPKLLKSGLCSQVVEAATWTSPCWKGQTYLAVFMPCVLNLTIFPAKKALNQASRNVLLLPIRLKLKHILL